MRRQWERFSRSLMAKAGWLRGKPPSAHEWLGWTTFWACMLVLALSVPEWSALPPQEATRSVLAVFLEAEAAFAALGLVVIVFLLESVRGRPDLDDDIFAEFLLRLQLVRIFQALLVMVGALATALVLAQPTPEGALWAPATGVSNLLLVGALILAVTLLSVGRIFVRTLDLMTPSRWRDLRRGVLLRLTTAALDAYLERRRRVAGMPSPDLADVLQVDASERRADEAIQTLITDAKRAFHERRLTDFGEVLEATRGLIESAMSQIEAQGFDFTDGGAGWLPWPPLRAVERELSMLRREVSSDGWSDFAYEVSRIDSWLIATGASRLAGEVLEVGLRGLEESYRLALNRGDEEHVRILQGRLWLLMRDAGLFRLARPAIAAKPRARTLVHRIVRQQSPLLEVALRHGRVEDARRLVADLDSLLSVLPGGAGDEADRERFVVWRAELQQLHRLVLLGILGLAIRRHAEDPEEAKRFLAVGRPTFRSLEDLAGDLVFALDNWHEEDLEWTQWETADAPDFKVISIRPEDYPIAYFTVRALELITAAPQPFRLGSRASWIRDIIAQNIDTWAAFATAIEAELPMVRRKSILLNLLDQAVALARQDEDDEIIAKPLDEDRVASFVADLYEHSVEAATLETLFSAAGRTWYMDSGFSAAPPEQGIPKYCTHKGPFTDATNWMDLDPRPLAVSLAEGLGRGLVEALADSPETDSPLVGLSPTSVLAAVRTAAVELDAAHPVVLLVGDWGELWVALGVQRPDGWLARRAMPPSGSNLFLAGYVDGMPVVRLNGSARAIYVVDLNDWGCLIRADCDGRELRVEIEPFTPEEARLTVRNNRKLFPSERTLGARARKLQTFVKLSVAQRKAFLAKDPSRARRISIVAAEEGIGSRRRSRR